MYAPAVGALIIWKSKQQQKKIERENNLVAVKIHSADSVVNSSETENIQIIVQQQASYKDYKEHSLKNTSKVYIN